MKLLLLLKYLAIILFFTSCATLKSPQNIISIDSNPRGIPVFDKDGKSLGITPFFTKMKQNKNHKLKIENKEFNYSCNFNWKGSLFPNFILSPLSFPTGALFSLGFQTIDLLSGGMFNCEDKLYFKVKNSKEIKHKKKRILILPLQHNDELFSDKISLMIMQKYKFKESQYISIEKAKTILHLKKINNFNDNNPKYISNRTIKDLAQTLNLTHIIYAKLNRNNKKYEIKPTLQDLFTRKSKKLKPFYTKAINESSLSPMNLILDAISFIPNSITLEYSPNPEFGYYSAGISQVDKVNINPHPDALPKAFGMIAIETSFHPKLYRQWDYQFYLAPSYHSLALQYLINDYTINIETYSILYGGFALAQTPFGQFTLGLSFGFLYLSASDSLLKKTKRTSISSRLDFRYKYFFNDRWYAHFSTQLMSLSENTLNYNEFQVFDTSKVAIGIGYYFPEVISLTRALFK